MGNTSKKETAYNTGNVLSSAFNPVDKSLTTSGFLIGKVGHKIVKSTPDAVTEDYSYYDSDVLLYTYRIIYTDATKAEFLSAERIA